MHARTERRLAHLRKRAREDAEKLIAILRGVADAECPDEVYDGLKYEHEFDLFMTSINGIDAILAANTDQS